MQVKLTPEFVYVKTPYQDRDFVRESLNGVYSKGEKMNRFPRNIHAMRELIMNYPELRNNTVFVDAGKKLAQIREDFLRSKSREDANGNPRLRPYQRVDVDYLKKLPNAGIFNQQRTGKTPTAIQLMREIGGKKNIVICPASLTLNWKAEFLAWAPYMHVYMVGGNLDKRRDQYERFRYFSNGSKVLVISKDTWKRDLHHFKDYEFDTCFVDEAHFLRNYDSIQSEAVLKVRAKRRYAITGTPSANHAKDIYGILKFLYPERFPSYWQFVERYFGTSHNGYGTDVNQVVKPERKAELEELTALISVQRKRAEVMTWLPEKQYITLPVRMGDKQRKLYNQMRDWFIAQDDDSDTFIDTENTLAQMTRLRQLCLDPALIGFDIPSSKTAAILEYLDNNREPVVVMSMFTSYLHRLHDVLTDAGYRVGMIHGEMSAQEKDASVQRFQNGETDIQLCNIISAGVGFTMDRARLVIFTDKSWTPIDNEQAEDRITPVTEDRNHAHDIVSVVCDDSIDAYFDRLLSNKQSLIDIIHNGGPNVIRRLLMGEL